MTDATVSAAPDYSVFNAMVDIIASPARALDETRHRTRWLWWPLTITILSGIVAFTAYYLWVDFEWLTDEIIRTSGAPPEAAESMRAYLSPGMQIGTTVVGIVLATLIIYAIQAAYLNLVNKVVGDPDISYGQWFSFSAWTGFVGIFNALAILVVMLTAGTRQVGPDQLGPLSLNALLIHAEPGTSWATWGSSLTLVHFWIIGLMALGFSRWTKSSLGKSLAVVIAPWACVFGIWAAVIA